MQTNIRFFYSVTANSWPMTMASGHKTVSQELPNKTCRVVKHHNDYKSQTVLKTVSLHNFQSLIWQMLTRYESGWWLFGVSLYLSILCPKFLK